MKAMAGELSLLKTFGLKIKVFYNFAKLLSL